MYYQLVIAQGFIKQSEQFEDRNVASDDTSNYKIVEKNDFAYNPARINVGSIARLTKFEDWHCQSNVHLFSYKGLPYCQNILNFSLNPEISSITYKRDWKEV
ncbi:hypothetical protein NXW94_16840 [Bacteroides ovatus]|nr:hypothetical protein [Bacteroides ovatus]